MRRRAPEYRPAGAAARTIAPMRMLATLPIVTARTLAERLEAAGIRARVTQKLDTATFAAVVTGLEIVWIDPAADIAAVQRITRSVLDERSSLGIECLRCGYDLRGHAATGVCPECGETYVGATDDARCESCGRLVPPNFETCWSCGGLMRRATGEDPEQAPCGA
jgi:predicted RNA-binding Zn-ribbon protein involved in translation (DUF1610 family)